MSVGQTCHQCLHAAVFPFSRGVCVCVCVALVCVCGVSMGLGGALLSSAFCVTGGGPGQRAISQQPQQESLQASGNVFTRQQRCSAPIGHGRRVYTLPFRGLSSVLYGQKPVSGPVAGLGGSVAFSNTVACVLCVHWGVFVCNLPFVALQERQGRVK